MKRLFTIAALTLALGLTAAPAFAKGKWVSLLDGRTKSLDVFDKTGDANWRLEKKGVVVADKGNGFLVTKKDYKNFHLRAQFWAGPDANSGIFVHATDPKDIGTKTAYEINIWDDRPEKDYATGAIVGIAKVDPMPKTVGKWNTYDITVKDGVFNVMINGKATVKNAKDTKFPNGRIALQHGLGNKDASGKPNDAGIVKFRNVKIREL